MLGFESDQATEDFDQRYTQYMVQCVTGRASGYLYGESREDILGHVEYGHLVDFFRVYNRDYGDLATRYGEEKQQANNSSFLTMRKWMPDNFDLDESRIRLLRNGPDVQFKSFRRAAIPDVDVPGNMLHVRPVGALGRN